MPRTEKPADLTWLSITDFSYGIHEQPSSRVPVGAATIANTARCIADVSGSLVPGPRLVETVSFADDEEPYTALVGAGLNAEAVRICGVLANDPVFTDNTAAGVDQSNTEIYVAFEVWRDSYRTRSFTVVDHVSNGVQLYVDKDSEGLGRLWAVNPSAANDTFSDDDLEDTWTVYHDANPATNQSATAVYYRTADDVLVADLSSINGGSDLYVRSDTNAGKVTTAGSANQINSSDPTAEYIKITHSASPSSGALALRYGDSGNALYANFGADDRVVNTAQVDELLLAIYRYSHHEDTPQWSPVWCVQRAPKTFDATVRPKRCSFMQGRSNNADPDVPGYTVVGWAFDGYACEFPDSGAAHPTLGANAAAILEGSLGDRANNDAGLVLPTDAVAHQGRAVLFPLTLSSVGDYNFTDAVAHTNNEGMYWSTVNDWQNRDAALTQFFTLFGYEIPTGYGVLASLTADELLLVKSKGGGLLIRGSLNDPYVKSLPMMKGTGHAQNRGVATAHGFLYPVDGSGVWRWRGGDFSEHLTPQMKPDFWKPIRNPAPGWGYQFSGWAEYGELALIADNYLLDFDPKGGMGRGPDAPAVWRIDETSNERIFWWTTDWKGRWAFGAPDRLDVTNDSAPVLYIWDKTLGATSMTWQSHPIQGTIDRRIHVREVVVEATGTGSVVLTLTAQNLDGSTTSRTLTYALSELADSTLPKTISMPTTLQGTHLRVKIAPAGSGGSEAPAVHGVHFGIYPDHRLNR